MEKIKIIAICGMVTMFLLGFVMAVFMFSYPPILEWDDNYNQLKETWSDECLFLNTDIKRSKNGYSYRPHELFCLDK